MSKMLYVLVGDNGDGSYSTHYTLNADFINQLQEKYENGDIEAGAIGCDGDGFHYDELTVPDDVTMESLGQDDLATYFND